MQDFVRILKAIGDGSLMDNIAFHLLLDIGQFLGKNTIVSNYRTIQINDFLSVDALIAS